MIALISILVVLFLIAWPRIIKKLHPRPAPPIVARFLDSPLRRWMQPLDRLIRRSNIRPGMTILEIGCGSGAVPGRWRTRSSLWR